MKQVQTKHSSLIYLELFVNILLFTQALKNKTYFLTNKCSTRLYEMSHLLLNKKTNCNTRKIVHKVYQLKEIYIFLPKTGSICTPVAAVERSFWWPREGKREPLLKLVTTELAVVTAVTSKRRLARFWAFSTVVIVGSFSARLATLQFTVYTIYTTQIHDISFLLFPSLGFLQQLLLFKFFLINNSSHCLLIMSIEYLDNGLCNF